MTINNFNLKIKRKCFKIMKEEHDIEDVGNVFPEDKEFIKILKRKLIREKFLFIEDD